MGPQTESRQVDTGDGAGEAWEVSRARCGPQTLLIYWSQVFISRLSAGIQDRSQRNSRTEELGDLSLRKTRSESTSICVILQLCRGLAVTKSSMGRAALPPWILLGKAFVTAYSQA